MRLPDQLLFKGDLPMQLAGFTMLRPENRFIGGIKLRTKYYQHCFAIIFAKWSLSESDIWNRLTVSKTVNVRDCFLVKHLIASSNRAAHSSPEGSHKEWPLIKDIVILLSLRQSGVQFRVWKLTSTSKRSMYNASGNANWEVLSFFPINTLVQDSW